MKHLLSIDIGNSTIGLGLFAEPIKNDRLLIKKIPSHPLKSVKTYRKIISDFIKQDAPFSLSPSPLSSFDVILSSVVPSLERPVIAAIKDLFGKRPLVVTHRLKTGVSLDIMEPAGIGNDRIANAVAGIHYSKNPVAVIDFGTATTITVVGRQQNLIGGAILPGLELMKKALYSETAKLPLIDLNRPLMALGKDTSSAITSGIIIGTVGAIDALIKAIEKEIGVKLKLLITGGHAKLMSPLIKKEHLLIPDLTFKGLRSIYLEHLIK